MVSIAPTKKLARLSPLQPRKDSGRPRRRLSIMQVTMSFPEAELASLLERFQRETGKSWPEVLRQQGRLIAVNLAYNTQPYGFDDKSQALGQKAVMRDIGRVFWSFSKTYEFLKEKSVKAARAFYGAAINGNFKRAAKILQASGIDAPIGTIKSEIHQERRDRRGHVRGKKNHPAVIVKNSNTLETYGKRIEKRVGFGKAGWATCAKALGGTRGIPLWSKRGKAPGSVDDQSHSFNNPHITMKNDVRYISYICTQAAVTNASRMQREKMLKHMEKVVHAAGRKSGLE